MSVTTMATPVTISNHTDQAGISAAIAAPRRANGTSFVVTAPAACIHALLAGGVRR